MRATGSRSPRARAIRRSRRRAPARVCPDIQNRSPSTRPVGHAEIPPTIRAALAQSGRTVSPSTALPDEVLAEVVESALASMTQPTFNTTQPSNNQGRSRSPDTRTIMRSVGDVFAYVTRRLNTRQRLVLDRRHAISERERWTLEEIGEELGVTRERVRQIERTVRDIVTRDAAEANLSRLRVIIRTAAETTHVATSEEELIKQMTAQGVSVTPQDLRIIGMFIAFGLIKVPPGVHIDFGSALPVTRGQPELLAIVRAALRFAGNTGAASARVIGSRFKCPQDECREILRSNGFKVVTEEWLIPLVARESFVTDVTKLFVYCGDCIGIGTIRNALRQRRRRRSAYREMPTPPVTAIAAALLTTRAFVVCGGSIIWRPSAQITEDIELHGAAQVVMETIDHFGVATFFEIRDAIVAAGYAPITGLVALTTAGLFRRIEVGLYARITDQVSLGAVTQARSRRPLDVAAAATLTYLRTGVVRVELNIGTWGQGGVLATTHLDRLSGRWPINAADQSMGVAVVRNGYVYGLTRAFQALHIDRGDRARLDFEARSHTLSVSKRGSR